MTTITTEQIKELRDETGISVMQIKKALEEAEGDREKALMVLKKKSGVDASKRSERSTKEGLIVIKTEGEKTIVLTLGSETDFVSKNDDFIALAHSLTDTALADGIDAMREHAPDIINPVIQKIGENIQLIDVEIYTTSGDDQLNSYVHSGKYAVVVVLSGGTPEIGKDVAMHIAAMKPEYIRREDIDEKSKTMAEEMFQKEVDESDKPAEIKEKMLQGKIDSYFKERTLLDQTFIKNGDQTVGQLLEHAADGPLTIKDFKIYSIG
ncbi:translation elongation factor Ts [Candidatus Wolfebacteria bacterium]|nr:MAG: translation elongation factor Ts [Candidatus Wolfebacteria bacterium]